MDGASTEMLTYAVIFAGVAVGALLPIIPTGALVGAGAALAIGEGFLPGVALVVASASAAAMVGDLALLALLNRGSGPLRRWLGSRVDADRLEERTRQLHDRPVAVLAMSRLVPGGRIPVMLAAILTGQSWRWFFLGNSVAVVVWALLYAAIGVLGGVVFDQVWLAVALAVVLVVVINAGPGLVRRAIRHG